MTMSTSALSSLVPDAAGGGAAEVPARVLVVDDNEANRESLSRRLQRRGYLVTTAEDGAAALAAVGATEFDVVILDVMMPGISGLEVLTTIRQTRPPAELPVIMATARDSSDAVVEAMELGANDYVTKPLDFASVLARVRTQVSLGRSVRQVLELERQLSRRNAELESANETLRENAEQTRRDLVLAAKVQATFLPRPLPSNDRLRSAWRYLPCQELAGDALNICFLDDDHVAVYVLDVSGHGVAASLTAVAAARLLAPGHESSSILVRQTPTGGSNVLSPGEVLRQLSAHFEWNPDTTQFLTVFYGVLHLPTRKFTYASAGHPSALRISPAGVATALDSTGMPIGIDLQDGYEQREIELDSGDRIYIYSDGVIEAMSKTGEQFGLEQLAETVTSCAGRDLAESVTTLLTKVELWREGGLQADDVSALVIECS